jgi:hypothetical protein
MTLWGIVVSRILDEERSREKEFDVPSVLLSLPVSGMPLPPLPLLSPFLSTCDEVVGEKRGECRAVAVAIITGRRRERSSGR